VHDLVARCHHSNDAVQSRPLILARKCAFRNRTNQARTGSLLRQYVVDDQCQFDLDQVLRQLLEGEAGAPVCGMPRRPLFRSLLSFHLDRRQGISRARLRRPKGTIR